MKAQTVIFDIDGTLLDSVDGHARSWVEAFEKFGVQTSLTAVSAQIGKGADRLLPVFVPTDMPPEIQNELKDYRAALFRKKYFPGIKPFPHVRELFLELRAQKIGIALASSCQKDEMEAYAERAGINGLFDAAVTADDAASSKPAPDIYHALLQRIAPTLAGQCIGVGDTPYDALAATKAGIKALGVLSGGFKKQELQDAGCALIVGGIGDLLGRRDWLDLSDSG